MKIIVAIALALITNSLFKSFIETTVFQKPASSPQPSVQVDVSYDKKRDVTRLGLEPIPLWTNRHQGQFERVILFVEFQCPNKKIVRPKEVVFMFSASSQNFVSFPSLEFSVSIDGALVELGKLKGSQRKQIYPPASLTVYEDESITMSYENFSRIATAKSVTLIIGKRKFDLPSGHIRLLHEFHKLMQREGEEIK